MSRFRDFYEEDREDSYPDDSYEEDEYGSNEYIQKKKRRNRRTRAGSALIFSVGILSGVGLTLLLPQLMGISYNAGSRVRSQQEEQVREAESADRPLEQEDIDRIRANTDAGSEEVERILSNYDDDLQRRKLTDNGSEEPEKVAAADINEDTVHIEWDDSGEGTLKVSGVEDEPDAEPAQETQTELSWDESVSGSEVSEKSEKTARSLIEELKQSLINGDGTMTALRRVFVDQIMVTKEGNFYFFPISDEIKHHPYDPSSLIANGDGTLDYMKDDGTMAKKGVDVSRYQGAIDWEKVAGSGVEFAFIRAGFRGYGSGEISPDETFLANATAASAQGIEIGVYFFTQATTVEEAREEARFVIDSLGGNSIAYPVVLDVERVKGGRINALGQQALTDVCLAFCDTVREAGYEPMIYGNMETFMLMLDINRLEDVSKWFAYYNPEFYYPYNYDIWQYSAKGHIDGIPGEVDLNLSFR